MSKFGRNYKLLVQDSEGDFITIQNPLTVEFDVTRTATSSVNNAVFKVYNLGENSRNRIFQDRFDPREYKKVIFQAGYDDLNTLFIGNLFEAYNVREGNNIVTYMESRDGGFDISNTFAEITFAKNTSIDEIIKELSKKFPNLTLGKFGQIEGSVKRGVVLDGNVFSLLKKYSNERVYIDLEKINMLSYNEVIEGDVPLLTSDTGLLGTPRRSNSYLSIETIFNPQILISQIIEINSDIAKQYNGQYKVIGCKHSGTISEAVGGDCKTTLDLLMSSFAEKEFEEVG